MKVFITSVFLIGFVTSFNTYAGNAIDHGAENAAKNCRQAVVDTSVALRNPLSATEFSVLNKNSYAVDAQEFNTLSSEKQAKIYMKLKPLKVMVEDMVQEVNSTINYLASDPFAALFRAQLLQSLRSHRDALRACSL